MVFRKRIFHVLRLRKKIILMSSMVFMMMLLLNSRFRRKISERGPIFLRDNVYKTESDRYVDKLANLMSGELIAPGAVREQDGGMNIGLVIINPNSKLNLYNDFRNDEFVIKTERNLDGILQRAGSRPIHFIIVTDESSSSWAGQILARSVCKRLSMGVIQKGKRWFKTAALPTARFSLVDSAQIIEKNEDFINGMYDNREPDFKEKNRYSAKFFLIAPLYHLAFTALRQILFIDSSDLEFLIDIGELYDQFTEFEEEKEAIMSVGLDLAPHYRHVLGKYRDLNAGTKFGDPGRYQGFNTGVVLYRLDRMRQSDLYNSYLNSKSIVEMTKTFMYKISLAEQDFFTNLGFLHPSLFHVLPCQFNKQESIQYLAPPFEEIFESYHYCDEKKNIKVYHINGCGPTLELCKHQNMTGSRYQNDTSFHFLHANFEVFWS